MRNYSKPRRGKSRLLGAAIGAGGQSVKSASPCAIVTGRTGAANAAPACNGDVPLPDRCESQWHSRCCGACGESGVELDSPIARHGIDQLDGHLF
jgi:hypothetical protein